MTKPFDNLRKKMSIGARKRADAKTKVIIQEMLLNEVRQARELSQEKLAEKLHVKQANISKIERRTDMYISTLSHFVEAMGGKLRIYVDFPEGLVEINQFQNLGKTAHPSAPSPSPRDGTRVREN